MAIYPSQNRSLDEHTEKKKLNVKFVLKSL